ncbi:MAG TPA: pyrroline-5-carboxylate reductase [Nitrospira sp.]|nr:pyrroline-5-carboxylate reductase [Nitrospira sp.]
MTSALTNKLAFIGGGQMAEAIIGGLLAANLYPPEALWATDPVPARCDRLKTRFAVRVGSDNAQAVGWADVVMLVVKPQVMPTVLEEIGADLHRVLIISVAAGLTIQTIMKQAPGATRVIRAMPNMPALVREGMTALAWTAALGEEDKEIARVIFQAVGRVISVEERLMDAVTGLSGSGPAYVFQAIEALADGGVKMGLPRQTAEVLAAQTVLGAAKMVLDSGDHPAKLKDRVASPGGTTIAGLHCLEEGRFRATLMGAVEAATKRSQELAR